MEQKKKRKIQKNVTLRDITYEQLHAYCEEYQIKHSEFVEIALHTFLHMHGSPQDICKNIVKEHSHQDKMIEDLLKTMLKSNRLQKKILAMSSVSLYGTEELLAKAMKGEALDSFEAGFLIGHGYCPKCGKQLQQGSFTNKINGKITNLIQCPNWQSCGFQIRGVSGTSLEAIVGPES